MADTIRELDISKIPMVDGFLKKEFTILNHSHECAKSLLKSYNEICKGEKERAEIDKEQDLLRAMLVFATAGMDSMLKHLIRESLPELVRIDPKVKTKLESFISRQLRGTIEESSTSSAHKFLSKILASESHQKQVIQEYINKLTGRSLQSVEELFGAIDALGLDPKEIGIVIETFKKIFEARNKIVHELDINFDVPTLYRENRDREQMINFTNTILDVSEKILCGVGKMIEESPDPKR